MAQKVIGKTIMTAKESGNKYYIVNTIEPYQDPDKGYYPTSVYFPLDSKFYPLIKINHDYIFYFDSHKNVVKLDEVVNGVETPVSTTADLPYETDSKSK